MIRSVLQRALFWKVGLPVLLVLLGFGALIMLPAIVAGGSKPEQAEATTSVDGLSDAVPAEYREILLRAGNICEEITPALLAAQIEAESGWSTEATSPVGAAGIAQFMPETWKGHGKDGDDDGKADIRNPIDAIWSQGNYMCELATGVQSITTTGINDGDTVELTLAAYNAGLGNVQAFNGIPPFLETQNYVKNIKAAIPKYDAPTALVAGSGSSSVVEAGKKYIGRPYRGEGPGGIDCCVFVQTAVRDAIGIELPMFTPGAPMVTAKCESSMLNQAESYGGSQIPVSQKEPGDLLFFQSTSISASVDSVTHVGIYIGNEQMVDSIPGSGVGIHDLSYFEGSDALLDTAVRLPGSK